MPQQGGSPDADGFASGNADELFRIRDQIASSGADITIVLSSDHVYRFDFNDAIETHRTQERRVHGRDHRGLAGRRPRTTRRWSPTGSGG